MQSRSLPDQPGIQSYPQVPRVPQVGIPENRKADKLRFQRGKMSKRRGFGSKAPGTNGRVNKNNQANSESKDANSNSGNENAQTQHANAGRVPPHIPAATNDEAHTQNHGEKYHDHQNDHKWTKWSTILSGIAAVIAFAALILSMLQLRIANQSLVAVQRPFVVAGDFTGHMFGPDKDHLDDLELINTWENTGNTPTLYAYESTGTIVTKIDHSPNFQDIKDVYEFPIIIAPHKSTNGNSSTFNLTRIEDLLKSRNGNISIV